MTITRAAAPHISCRRLVVCFVLRDPTQIGGLCALNGCNPKKVLVRAIEVLQLVREAGKHGIRTGEAHSCWRIKRIALGTEYAAVTLQPIES